MVYNFQVSLDWSTIISLIYPIIKEFIQRGSNNEYRNCAVQLATNILIFNSEEDLILQEYFEILVKLLKQK